MGAFLDSLSVCTGDAASVRAQVAGWLSAKGFELRDEAPLFPVSEAQALIGGDGGDDRALFLIWNAQWTVVLFSHVHTEGPRLLWEFGRRPAPVVQTWVHDSDLWGYKLHKDGELLAAFNSNPRYFGVEEELATGQNGDPTLLCATCGLGDLAVEMAEVQSGRAVFMEGVCQRFCTLLGAAPACHGYGDLADLGLDVPGLQTVGGYQVEHLYFLRRDRYDEPPPDLHRLQLRPPLGAEEQPHVELSGDQWFQLRAVQFLLWLLFVLLRPVIWVFVLLIRWRNRGMLRGVEAGMTVDPFTQALTSAMRPPVRRDGRQLINERHHYRLVLPNGVELGAVIGSLHVFHLTILGQTAAVEVVRPGQLEQRLRLYVGMTVTEHESFSIGMLPARRLVRRHEMGALTRTEHVIVVQAAPAFHLFWLAATEEMPPEAPSLLRELVNTFTGIDVGHGEAPRAP
jgi:hypothetical protein